MTARHQRDACITRCHKTSRRSQQLRELVRSLAYWRRHWRHHHSDAVYCQTISRYTALMCLPVCCSVATLTGRLACELRLARTTQESHDSHISSGALEYFFCWLSILCRSCIFHPCDMLPHFPLLYFPLPHFQRPQLHMHLTALEHITLTSR